MQIKNPTLPTTVQRIILFGQISEMTMILDSYKYQATAS